MNLLDPVIYYTHEASDTDHNTRDEAALVLRVIDDNTVDVVIIPPGGPFRYARVSRFDPDAPAYVSGGSYFRGVTEDPPDFGDHFAYVNDPRWIALRRKQTLELEAVHTPQLAEETAKRHLDEQHALNEQIAKEAAPKVEKHR